MNIFQLEYEARLQSWHDLKEDIKNSDLRSKCIKIDKWWQNAPTVNHYLHLKDTNLARSLGTFGRKSVLQCC